ncbi:MAG: haloacid dehalogenase-like hydrolase [Elusimicrobia bacterium]|nr:haloacid dehalogenase-like hydrolase [Elusimicrobiota bacterium]
MKVGIDFDNTIVCYDRLFLRLAAERGLVPKDLPPSKGGVRDLLRKAGHEETWIQLQGLGYGERIQEAEPFPGALEFLRRCKSRGVETCVISHKTLHPFRGAPVDLHEAAKGWLRANGFLSEETGLTLDAVHLKLTKAEKLEAIGGLGCTHFVDDLPEFLSEPAFPAGVERILFDPSGRYGEDGRWRRAGSWPQVESLILASR